MEKEMASHSSILAWRIPWTEEPGGLQSMESQGQVGLSDLIHNSRSCLRCADKCRRHGSSKMPEKGAGLSPRRGDTDAAAVCHCRQQKAQRAGSSGWTVDLSEPFFHKRLLLGPMGSTGLTSPWPAREWLFRGLASAHPGPGPLLLSALPRLSGC